MRGILGRLDSSREGPMRRRPERSGRFVAEGLMRSLVVVASPESVEATLLGAVIRRGGPCGVLLQGSVHPLVSAVLLRARGLNSLMLDAEPHPPRIELAEAMDAGRRKRRTVVAAHRQRHSHLAKEPFKRRFCTLGSDVWQAVNAEQVATVQISNGQRIAVNAVACSELTLEVRRPEVVRRRRRGWYSTRVLPLSTTPPRLHEPVSLKNVGDGAARRPLELRVSSAQHSQQLPCSPAHRLSLRCQFAGSWGHPFAGSWGQETERTTGVESAAIRRQSPLLRNQPARPRDRAGFRRVMGPLGLSVSDGGASSRVDAPSPSLRALAV